MVQGMPRRHFFDNGYPVARATLAGERMQRRHRMAQLLVRALLAPVPLADGVRHRAPAVPLRAFPVHQRQAVDVALGETASTAAHRAGLDFIEGQFAHGFSVLFLGFTLETETSLCLPHVAAQ